MSLYVYCLGRELRGAGVESLAGVADAPVRVSESGELAAVVSEFEGARVAPTREHLLAHNRVLAQVLAHETPLPFRFGTLSDAASLRSYVSQNRDALASNLERVRGCVEMSVKVLWDEASDDAASGASTGSAPPNVGAGAAFLAAKRAALRGGERRRARAEEIGAWVAERLAPYSREARSSLSPEERIVLRASHLVERVRVGEYREAVRRLEEQRGAALRFLVSGPWPPYSFCDARPSKSDKL